MNKKKSIYLGLVAVIMVILGSGCSSKSSQLLKAVPENAAIVAHFNGEQLLSKADTKELASVVDSDVLGQISLITKAIDARSIVLFATPNEKKSVAIIKVKDYQGLKDLLVASKAKIEEKEGLTWATIPEQTLLFNKEYLWLALNESSIYAAQEASQRLLEKKPSIADRKGIEQILKEDIGFYVSTYNLINQEVASLGIKNLDEYKNQSLVANISFEEKDIKSQFKILDEKGKAYKNPFGEPKEIDKKLLDYISAKSLFLITGAFDNKSYKKIFETIPETKKTPEMKTLFENIDGTYLLGAVLTDLYETPEITLISQVKKGKEKEVQNAIARLFGISTEEKLGEDIVGHLFFLENLYIGARDGFVTLSTTPVNKHTPSYKENELSKMIRDKKSYVLVDLNKDSFLTTLIAEEVNYKIDGYLAINGDSNKGEMVFHNNAVVDNNILTSLIKAFAKTKKIKVANEDEEDEVDDIRTEDHTL